MKRIYLISLLFLLGRYAAAQGLEDVIVETYYVSDANDATDVTGGSLPEGSVTYRIYMDMSTGYELQAVYGNAQHLLRLQTTTQFFNNVDRGELTGEQINDSRLDENTVALDSWVTLGPASDAHFGVLKSEDVNGSIIGGANNDGGSANVPGGLLINQDPLAGIPLTSADGLIPGSVPMITVVGLDLGILNNFNAGTTVSTSSGAWSVLEGVQGPTVSNRVLVAQITTDGQFSFELNVQLGAPDGSTEQYVASNPQGDENFFAALNFPLVMIVQGCTDSEACNFDPAATEEDGSCVYAVAGCLACNGEGTGLLLVDADGDGICDLEEIAGCSNVLACNYLPAATDDDGSCLLPSAGCEVCNTTNDGLILVDQDGDGVCDAEEIPGCTDPDALNYDPEATEENGTCSYSEVLGCTIAVACNYNPFATTNDGTCILPIPGCAVCNTNEDGLDIVDSDGDGVCDAEEVTGCTDPEACNYSPDATDEDNSCLFAEEGCSVCVENGLVLIDADNDGVCDAQEVSGCTSMTACNYDPEATDDNGACLEPVAGCLECDNDNTGLIPVDADGDGVCDAEEGPGCSSPSACNYDPTVDEVNDDGSCLEPVEDCYTCNAQNDALILVDADGDGVCNAEEVEGCTDPLATNYDPLATEDDGSCIYTSIDEIDSRLNVYPNPATDKLNVVCSGHVQGAATFLLVDATGRVVLSREVYLPGEDESVQLDVAYVARGAYTLVVRGSGEMLRRAVILQ